MYSESSNKESCSDAIQPINRQTVHRICSGQVVLSLAIAVKELVENSIDAEATIINIYLKEYGSDLIEVSDNGKGVPKDYFQALTLKHYTSKIKQFDDLETITTLGFRGEALSSLCALSDLSITTKHILAENATRISYDHNGHIRNESLCAREQGTTVTLENLFFSLPVRRKEFLKNLKREFNKMCQLLYAYCLVSKGIKFVCTNVTKKGSKSTVVATQGLNTVRENIINVFGPKQISSLIDIEPINPEEETCAEFGVQYVEGQDLPFSYEFFISSVMHGSGRSSTDRQFFYINSRPCEPTKIMKLVNQIYKQYNSGQFPFVFLNIVTKSCLVDVNVTPDKRQVFLEKEKLLMAALKGSLIDSFKTFPSTFKMQNLDLTQNSTINDFFGNNNGKGLKRSVTETSSNKKGSLLDRFGKRSKTENDKHSVKTSDFRVPSRSLSDEIKCDSSLESVDDSDLIDVASTIIEHDEDYKEHKSIKLSTVLVQEKLNTVHNVESEVNWPRVEEIKIICPKEKTVGELALTTPIKVTENVNKSLQSQVIEQSKTFNGDGKENIKIIKDCPEDDQTTVDNNTKAEYNLEKIKTLLKEHHSKTAKNKVVNAEENLELSIDEGPKHLPPRKAVTLNVSLDDIRKSLKDKIKQSSDKGTEDVKVRFRSQITPEGNKSAEEELQKQITKDDFKEMEVIGQFNLGFVIARLKNDLFIIDQHATDEKYNFEQLQANMVLDSQVLVNPKSLELTAGNESLLIENEDLFKKSGFAFKIDHSAPCTKKVSLTAVPLSRNFVFGKDDIDEMLFMLQDSNQVYCRPTRVRAMLASRACRKSVMIGKALSKGDMKKLIEHMGDIEQPWNCPHGRPTMRHLINLDLLQKE